MNHLRLRHFLMGFAHANSAPPQFGLEDIAFNSPYITSTLTPDEIEDEMMQVRAFGLGEDENSFWESLGRLADAGYEMKGEDDTRLKCYIYLDETL